MENEDAKVERQVREAFRKADEFHIPISASYASHIIDRLDEEPTGIMSLLRLTWIKWALGASMAAAAGGGIYWIATDSQKTETPLATQTSTQSLKTQTALNKTGPFTDSILDQSNKDERSQNPQSPKFSPNSFDWNSKNSQSESQGFFAGIYNKVKSVLTGKGSSSSKSGSSQSSGNNSNSLASNSEHHNGNEGASGASGPSDGNSSNSGGSSTSEQTDHSTSVATESSSSIGTSVSTSNDTAVGTGSNTSASSGTTSDTCGIPPAPSDLKATLSGTVTTTLNVKLNWTSPYYATTCARILTTVECHRDNQSYGDCAGSTLFGTNSAIVPLPVTPLETVYFRLRLSNAVGTSFSNEVIWNAPPPRAPELRQIRYLWHGVSDATSRNGSFWIVYNITDPTATSLTLHWGTETGIAYTYTFTPIIGTPTKINIPVDATVIALRGKTALYGYLTATNSSGDSPKTVMATYCPGDVDNDGNVDSSEGSKIVSGTSSPFADGTFPLSDVDSNSNVDQTDKNYFNGITPYSCPSAATMQATTGTQN